MIIFKVSQKRFYTEYQKHVQNVRDKQVEWYVDEEGYVNMYIVVDSHSIAYLCKEMVKDLSEFTKAFINAKGAVLGIIEPKPVIIDRPVNGFVDDKLLQAIG